MKKRLTVLALAFAMVLTMSASVFAAGNGQNSGEGGVDSYSAGEAKIVKYLQVAENVTPPTTTFYFKIDPAPVTGAAKKAYSAEASDYPAAKTVSISVAQISGSTNYKGVKAISEIFTAADFDNAGEYTFTVTEVKDANGTALTAADDANGWTYAKDSYTLRLIVDKEKHIDDVTVQKPNGDKVDASDDDPEEEGDNPTPAASNGGFTFTNNYTKLVDTHPEPNPDYDPENPDDPNNPQFLTKEGALKVEKLVEGEYGDLTKDFEFTVNVTLPDDVMGYTADDLATNTPADKAIANGESFVYNVLPAGSKITIRETPVTGYTATYAGTKNTVNDGQEFVLSEEGQFVKVTNTFDDESVTPTGIIINNLPYVLLIGLALGGIVLFSRKRRYE